MRRFSCLIGVLLLATQLHAQTTYKVSGKVIDKENNKPLEATVFVEAINAITQTNSQGEFVLMLPKGRHKIEVYSLGKEATHIDVDLKGDKKINFSLEQFAADLGEVEVTGGRAESNGISRLRAIEGIGIYEAKKNELILLDDFAANKANSNARQVFAKVPGLNIWESDCAGLQLDIAARGLGPSRTANFNMRQNGYDMSADALGYPESYYLPSMLAVDKIEIVRGAASLQYGTQFGGMINFKLKEAAEKPFELTLDQTVGSFNLYNTFVSVSGTVNKVDYYSYYQYKTGDCWRKNSGFDSNLAFARIGFQANKKLKLGFEYSLLDYTTQQPGGLTDAEFNSGNLEKSNRNRNWFRVSWNLLAGTLDYNISEKSKLNVRTFGLISGRDALGNLEQIDRIDNPTSKRTLISDRFNNFGIETRYLNYFDFLGDKSALVLGARYYNGLTDRKQGNANASADPDFSFLNPEDLEDFDYDFPSTNVSFFAENLINLSSKLSVTPGVRLEHIQTDAVGSWKQIVRDFAGNIETENTFLDDRSVKRSFVLFGLGASYYFNDDLSIYANYSDNFRSVTFSDLRLNNPNFVLDSLITDESGFNIDLGIRGKITSWLNADISAFYLSYNDRIGVILPAGSSLLFRTNVGDTRHMGLESFIEINLFDLFQVSSKKSQLSFFSNFSIIDAQYTQSMDNAIQGNRVEYVPNYLARTGINYKWKNLKATYQFSALGEQFSDATNSTFNPNALTGIIPSYNVMDLSLEYEKDAYKITFGINNLGDAKYFTRRAESYPGPGIIPATPRSFYFSLGYRL